MKKLLMNTSMFFLLIVSSIAFAIDPDIKNLSPDELWSVADTVAVIRVKSGSYDNFAYTINAEEVVILKGKSFEELTFSFSFPFISQPATLSSMYLIFFSKSKNSDYKVIESENAVIKVMSYAVEDMDGVRNVVAKRNQNFARMEKFSNSVWASYCNESTESTICKNLLDVFTYAFTKGAAKR